MESTLIRLHVENDPRDKPALHLTPERLAAALAGRRNLPKELELSFNNDPQCFESMAHNAEILFTGRKVPKLDFAKRLKWVQSTSAGVETLARMMPSNAILTNARGVHRDKAGEFILAAVLMLNYAIPKFVTDKQRRRWDPVFGGVLRGKRVILLGVGAIGGEAARLVKSLGAVTIGVSRSGRSGAFLDESAVLAEIERFLPLTDFLVSSLPLTSSTRGRIDRAALDLLPRHAGIVSVGRAGVFDCEAIIDKLENESLAGAVFDVFPEEPIPEDSRYWSAPNLIITPHCSLDDHTVYLDRCLDLFLDNLDRYRQGLPLHNVVDVVAGY